MAVVIRKKSTRKKVLAGRRKPSRKRKGKPGIAPYFGALKRGLDGLAYQKQVRDDWN